MNCGDAVPTIALFEPGNASGVAEQLSDLCRRRANCEFGCGAAADGSLGREPKESCEKSSKLWSSDVMHRPSDVAAPQLQDAVQISPAVSPQATAHRCSAANRMQARIGNAVKDLVQ